MLKKQLEKNISKRKTISKDIP